MAAVDDLQLLSFEESSIPRASALASSLIQTHGMYYQLQLASFFIFLDSSVSFLCLITTRRYLIFNTWVSFLISSAVRFWTMNLLFFPSWSQNLTPTLFRSLVRLLLSLIVQPAASVSTLLFYSDILPQHMVSERLIRHELLDRENYLFHFLVNFLKCFWWKKEERRKKTTLKKKVHLFQRPISIFSLRV